MPPRAVAPLAGRPLAELLQEQQEPFLLDIYLLEKGYSAGGLCSEATATCCPAGKACRRALRRLAGHGFRRRGEGVLECLLRALSCRRSPYKGEGREPLRGTKEAYSSGKTAGVDTERTRRSEYDEAMQLSPVSVLELLSEDGSPTDVLVANKGEQEPSPSSVRGGKGIVELLHELHGSVSSKRDQRRGSRRPPAAAEDDKEEEITTPRRRAPQIRDRDLRESASTQGTAAAATKARRRRGSGRRSRAATDAAAALDLAQSDASRPAERDLLRESGGDVGAEIAETILDELIIQDTVTGSADSGPPPVKFSN